METPRDAHDATSDAGLQPELGIAVALWQSFLCKDNAAIKAIVESTDRDEIFRSCVDVTLLSMTLMSSTSDELLAVSGRFLQSMPTDEVLYLPIRAYVSQIDDALARNFRNVPVTNLIETLNITDLPAIDYSELGFDATLIGAITAIDALAKVLHTSRNVSPQMLLDILLRTTAILAR